MSANNLDHIRRDYVYLTYLPFVEYLVAHVAGRVNKLRLYRSDFDEEEAEIFRVMEQDAMFKVRESYIQRL
jgi:hypothetical protein